MERWQIIIEGTDYDQMESLFQEIQNNYEIFDNCVLAEVLEKDSIIDDGGRLEETGGIFIERPKIIKEVINRCQYA